MEPSNLNHHFQYELMTKLVEKAEQDPVFQESLDSLGLSIDLYEVISEYNLKYFWKDEK